MALWGQCSAGEVSQEMLHPGDDGTCRGHVRAEAGHHRAEHDPTQALVLVHASPQYEKQAAWPQPLVPQHPTEGCHQSSSPCPPARNKGIQKWC